MINAHAALPYCPPCECTSSSRRLPYLLLSPQNSPLIADAEKLAVSDSALAGFSLKLSVNELTVECQEEGILKGTKVARLY